MSLGRCHCSAIQVQETLLDTEWEWDRHRRCPQSIGMTSEIGAAPEIRILMCSLTVSSPTALVEEVAKEERRTVAAGVAVAGDHDGGSGQCLFARALHRRI